MTDNKLVLTTAGSKEEAQRIARTLVERRLAGCVNLVQRVESVYRWQGKIEEAEEWLLLIKTTGAAFERVRDAIRELHSYDLPECICLAIDGGSSAYLEWLQNSVE
jgi:periplasmic divalent cation tolerance protein